MSACPPEADLVAYAGGAAPAERQRIEAHMAECADCRVIVSMLAKGDDTAPVDPHAATVASTPPPAPAITLAPGDVFEQKYRIERVLGKGGMGVVYEATHVGLERRVAIKFMRPDAHESPEASVRFLREARACASLASDHVVRVFDNGMSERGEPYLVMELLRGEDLAHLLKRERSVSPARAAEWVLQACDAVGEAHSVGVVHRDLKPANLFLAEQKSGAAKVKVLDFGISKLIGEGSLGGLTSRSTLLGSPRYMSPEQTQSSTRTDARTDIWALGVVLYELVTGAPPFDAANPVGLAAAILTQDVPSMRATRPDVPPAFERVVLRCLEKRPGDRFESIDAFARALADAADARAPRKKLPRAMLAVLGVAAVLAGAGATAMAVKSRTKEPTAASAILTPIPIPIPSPTPTPIPIPTPSPTPTPTPSPTPTPIPTPSPTPIPSPSPSPTPTPSPSPTPTPSSHHRSSPKPALSPSSSLPGDLPGTTDRK